MYYFHFFVFFVLPGTPDFQCLVIVIFSFIVLYINMYVWKRILQARDMVTQLVLVFLVVLDVRYFMW